MTRRSKKLQIAIDQINDILKQENIFITTDGTLKSELLPADNPKSQAFKQGMVEAIQVMLHTLDQYKGYTYNKPLEKREKAEFNRKYY